MGESFVKIIRLSREPFRRKAAQRAERPAYPFGNVNYTSEDMSAYSNIHAKTLMKFQKNTASLGECISLVLCKAAVFLNVDRYA
jgi:hypothetical protein